MKKFIFFSVILVIVFIFFVIYMFMTITSSTVKLEPITTPDPNAGKASTGVSKPSQEISSELDKETAVGNIISSLPYQGDYFSFSFDYTKNSFILALDKNHASQGNIAFNEFLKENYIEDRSWFANLTIVNK
jgi:hypothetical protein